MPTQNPTVISASLDDSKLRNSIKSLVDFVQEQTKLMATSFDGSMSAIKKSMSDFPESVQRARQANRDLAESFESVGRAIRNAKSGGIGSYPAAGAGVFESEKKAIDEFNRKYKEAVDKAKAEQERLNQIAEMGRRSAEQSMRPRERWDVRQDSEINRLRMTIHGLELDLKRLDEIGLSRQRAGWKKLFDEQKAVEEQIKKYKQEQETLRKTPASNQFEQNAITQQFDLLTRKIKEAEAQIKQLYAERQKILGTDFVAAERGSLTQKLQAAKNEVKQLGQAMIDAENAEKGLAVGAEKIATEYAKITSRADTKKAFTQAVLMDDSTIESATAKAERLRNIMKEVYNTPFASAKQYKDLQMALSSVEQKIRELRSGKTGDIATDETTRVKKEAEAIKRSIDEQVSKEKERKEAIIQTGNAAQEQSRKIIEMMHWQLGKADETPILGVKQLSDEIMKMRRAYFEMSESEKESPIGKALKQDIEKANAALEAVQKYNRALMMQTGNVGDTVTLDKLRKTLKGLMFDYASLSQEETKSARGTALIDKIHKTESAINELQKRLARPTSLVNALKLPEDTLDRISEKIRQLQLYKGGLKITDPKQAAEIQQVDQEINRLGKDLNKYMASAKQTMQENNALSRSWNYMKNRLAFYFTVGASTQFVKNLIDIRSQYEMTERSLGILINSAERGTQIFNQLSDMALVSPYTLIELSNAAKQLIAYDVAAKDVVDTTRRLADMAAAVGIPMERLTYALGQIKAYGYLNSRDARMFANAGIPLVKQLSEYYTQLEGRMVSIGDVYTRMKKKTIEYNDVMSVINNMTDEGGKFFDFQAKMAGTLKVQLANLTLAWNNMLNSIGSSNQGILVGGVKLLKEFFLQWKNIERAISSLAIGFTIFKTLQIAALALAKNVSIIRTNLVATNEQLSYSGVLGSKMTKAINGIGGALKGLFTAQNGIFLVIFAIVDMVMKVNQANEAISELNKSIRDGAKETKNSLDEMLGSYSKLGDYTLTTDQKTGGVVSATYTGSKDPDEMQKTWTAIREEIETSTAYGKVFMGQLVTETDLSERLSKAFEITAKLRDVHGALQDISSDSIKVGQDMSAWWNLWWADKGLIEGLKYYNEYLTAVENKDLAIFDWKSIGENAQETVDRIQKELFDKIKENADETAKSISDAFKNLKFDPQQMREGFEEISNKIFEGKGLDPKTELQGRIELEKAFINQRKQMYIDAANEQARLGNQAQAEQIRASYNTWIKGFGQNQVLVNGFYDWLKSHHASELQSMFGNMTQDEINHIDWSKSKWQNWARENAQAFSKQMGTSFDDLWRWVQDASTWRVHIGVILDTTQIQKSVFETLSNADTKANEAYQHIKRLNDEITRLQGKSNRTKEENEKLTKAINERNVAQDDYNKAVAEGGKSAKEASDANKSAAAARKAHTAATRAQRQAESELQRSLKEELSIVDKIRNTYKDLRKAGVGTTEAIALASSGYEKSVKAINTTLAKFGLERFDPSKFAGIENPHELLTMFENQLNKLIASGKAKPAEIVELETKINEMKIDVKKFDIEKITKGLNSELDKLKDEYELGVELDANPALGDIFAAMMGIPSDMVNELPKDIDDAARLAQTAIKNSLGDAFSNFDVYANVNKDFLKKWFADNAIDAESELAKQITAIIDWLNDIRVKETKKQIDEWDKLLEKYAEVAQKHKKIDEDAAKERETARKQNAPKWIFDAIDTKALRQHADVDFTEFQKSPDWVLATGNLSNLSSKALGLLIQKLEEYKRSATNLDPKQIERINKTLRNLRKEMRKNNPFSAISDAIDEGMANAAVFDGTLVSLEGKIKDMSVNYENLTEEEKAQLEDLIKEWERLVNLQEEASKPSAEKIVGIIGDWAGKIQSAANGIKSIGEAIGSEALTKTADALGDVAGNVQAAAEGYKTWGGWWGAVIGGVTDGLPKIIKWLSGDNGITEKVKDSELEVKKLENAYKSLEHTINKMYGEARYGAEQLAVANKKLQLAELERQLALEKSRKKKNQDESKILDLEGSIIDLKNEINDSINAIANDMLGISSVGDAAENLVSSMIEAFKNGEDWMKSYDETFESMIDNMIMKAIVGKVIGQRIQQIFDYVDSISSSEKQGVADQLAELTRQRERIQSAIATAENKLNSTTIDSAQRSVISKVLEQLKQQENNLNSQIALLTQQYNELGQITPENVDYLRELVSSERDATKRDFEFYADLFGLRFGQNKESANLSALQQGLVGVTEDTASAVEAYLNGMSQQAYLRNDILTEIRDYIVGFDIDVQTSVLSQMLLQMQASYAVQMSIQSTLNGWSNASGLAVRVEMV